MDNDFLSEKAKIILRLLPLSGTLTVPEVQDRYNKQGNSVQARLMRVLLKGKHLIRQGSIKPSDSWKLTPAQVKQHLSDLEAKGFLTSSIVFRIRKYEITAKGILALKLKKK